MLSAMSFNEILARKVLDGRDRDRARFFAGRKNEIAAFESALLEASESRQAVFRVFQGAPGCGKTALLEHLMANRSEDVLFVGVGVDDLAGRASLDARVHDAFVSAHSSGTRIVATAAADLARRFKSDGALLEARRTHAGREAREISVVFYMDEAQDIAPSEGRGLQELHTRGLGIPSVLLLAGLGHTAERLAAAGISRLADNAVVHMGALEERDCVESTLAMLGALRVSGTRDERERLAESAAELSFGWPQHLACTHIAQARELIRTRGDAGLVDLDAVRRETTEARHRYYRRRLDGTVLDTYPEFTAATVTAVRRDEPEAPGHLWDLCDRMLDDAKTAHPRLGKVSGEEFAAALTERGVLTREHGGPYAPTIPSMEAWLDGLAPGHGGGGRRRGTAAGTR